MFDWIITKFALMSQINFIDFEILATKLAPSSTNKVAHILTRLYLKKKGLNK